MPTEAVLLHQVPEALGRDVRPGWDRLRWALALVWVLFLAFAAVTGERRSSTGALEGDMYAAQVHAVAISDGSATGTAELHWRSGLTAHYARVDQPSSANGNGGTPAAAADRAVTRLQGEHPGLAVTPRADRGPGRRSTAGACPTGSPSPSPSPWARRA